MNVATLNSPPAGKKLPDVGRGHQKNRLFRFGWVLILLAGRQVNAEELQQKLVGDIGLGAYYTPSIVRGNSDKTAVLPYAEFEYGKLFSRVDTLGIKTLKLGYGDLELVGRISQDGFNTGSPLLQGLYKRDTSIPLGIGTLQVTPVGAIMANAFHDINKSQGNIAEVIYAGEIDLQRVTLYPLAGAEYQTKEYVRYYYGVSPQEAANSLYAAYRPGSSLNGLVGLIAEINLSNAYYLNFYARRKWLGDAIQSSPIVNQKYTDTAYFSISYRYK